MTNWVQKRTPDAELQYKSATSTMAVKADLDRREVTLLVAGFKNVDGVGDFIPRGAAAKSIKSRMSNGTLKFFFNHEILLGPVKTIEEADAGLLMVGNVTDSRDLDRYLAHADDGSAGHGSIGYRVPAGTAQKMAASEFEAQFGIDSNGFKQIRVLHEIDVVEGSVVIWPANNEARVIDVKSDQDPQSKGDLWDFATAVEAMAHLEMLTNDDFFALDEEQAALARDLLDQMTRTEERIESGLKALKYQGIAPILAELRQSRENLRRT